MYIIMHKLNEDILYVTYKIETDITAGQYINEQGKERTSFKTIFAYCKLNKQTEEFFLDINKTNPYFLEPNSREIRHAMAQLIKRVREKQPFEQSIHIATGG